MSSILDRQVLACRKTCRTLATLPEPLHPFGLAWDWGRKILWVAADCPPGVPAIKPCNRGSVIGLSPRGEVRYRFAPSTGAFHPGDVSANQSGVFASDSQNGLVWGLLSGRRGQFSPINRPGDGKSAQGTALAPSGTELIIADYERGIGRIDLKTTATTWLPHQEGKPLRGIDGLVRCGKTYLGVYNGGAIAARIWAIRMRPGGIHRSELVEGLTLNDPTQIAFDGKRLLIVSGSGWETIGKTQASRHAGAQILAIPLSRDCKPL